METKFTQGKWQTDAIYVVSDGAVVCDTYPNHDDAVINDEERYANVKLIAAAPELLESCIKLLSELGVDSETADINSGYSHIVTDALNAIKKATH